MKYFIIAGEASGDLHAANLMCELKRCDKDAEFCFLGGDLMRSQGGKQIKDYREMAFMGFIPVLRNLKKIKQNFEDCKTALLEFQPDLLILVDYPSFNLRIAEFVKKELKTPIYYYISPKIWAWKRFRIHSIKRNVDKMFTILPFETEFYAKYNYPVEYVGNPSVDSTSNRPNQEQTKEEFCRINKLSTQPIIAVLAGSRKQEITACLNTMLSAAKKFTDHQVLIAGAPGIEKSFYEELLKKENENILFQQTNEMLQHASAAIINSGTASLEAALIGTPQVVVYHVSGGRLAYLLKHIFIHVKHISLVNLIAKKELVKELIAHKFTTKELTIELEMLLRNKKYKSTMLAGYKEVKRLLGPPGAAKTAAEKMYKLQISGDKQRVKNT